jgi:uncharacterized membrane protein YdbT with pleckstrin-like domain
MHCKGRGGTWDARSWGNEYVFGEIAMLDLHIHKCAARHKEHRVDASLSADVSAQQAHRRWLLALVLVGSAVAAVAIAAGLPTTGLAIYLTIMLPFVFFT